MRRLITEEIAQALKEQIEATLMVSGVVEEMRLEMSRLPEMVREAARSVVTELTAAMKPAAATVIKREAAPAITRAPVTVVKDLKDLPNAELDKVLGRIESKVLKANLKSLMLHPGVNVVRMGTANMAPRKDARQVGRIEYFTDDNMMITARSVDETKVVDTFVYFVDGHKQEVINYLKGVL